MVDDLVVDDFSEDGFVVEDFVEEAFVEEDRVEEGFFGVVVPVPDFLVVAEGFVVVVGFFFATSATTFLNVR